jgi:choline dehydrogenase-like flavoprotein
LVIEYGPLDKHEPSVLVPGLLDLKTSPYLLFNLTSTPQRGLNNRTIEIPTGSAVGGGTVVNGIFFDRGAAAGMSFFVIEPTFLQIKSLH